MFISMYHAIYNSYTILLIHFLIIQDATFHKRLHLILSGLFHSNQWLCNTPWEENNNNNHSNKRNPAGDDKVLIKGMD